MEQNAPVYLENLSIAKMNRILYRIIVLYEERSSA